MKIEHIAIGIGILYLLKKGGFFDKFKILTGDSFGLPELKVGDHIKTTEQLYLVPCNELTGVCYSSPNIPDVVIPAGGYIGVIVDKKILNGKPLIKVDSPFYDSLFWTWQSASTVKA